MSNDVPLLTAEMAVLLRTYDPSVARPQLLAIADGRAVVVPRMTEAEALKKFEHAWDHFGIGERYHDTKAGYLAALRDLGIIRD